MDRIDYKSIDEFLEQEDTYNMLVISSKQCDLCEMLIPKLDELLPQFGGKIVARNYYVEPQRLEEIKKRFKIDFFIPRTVIYKAGVEVGRMLEHVPEQLREQGIKVAIKPDEKLLGLLNELVDTGRILCDNDDVEAQFWFRDKVYRAMFDKTFRLSKTSEEREEISEVSDMVAEYIMRRTDTWTTFSEQDLRDKFFKDKSHYGLEAKEVVKSLDEILPTDRITTLINSEGQTLETNI